MICGFNTFILYMCICGVLWFYIETYLFVYTTHIYSFLSRQMNDTAYHSSVRSFNSIQILDEERNA